MKDNIATLYSEAKIMQSNKVNESRSKHKPPTADHAYYIVGLKLLPENANDFSLKLEAPCDALQYASRYGYVKAMT